MFLYKKIIKKLIKKNITISVVESCTGGLLSSTFISVPGVSKIFNMGLITYSNKAKTYLLKISQNHLKKYGAVSNQTANLMVKNLQLLTNSKLCISTTGIAGPSGGTKKKPVGLIFLGIKKDNKFKIKKFVFKNKGREYIQKITVKKSLELILGLIK